MESEESQELIKGGKPAQKSQKITFYETNTQKLKKENLELEAYLYKINSLQYTSSQAAKLEFSKKADPYFLENLRFALKK